MRILLFVPKGYPLLGGSERLASLFAGEYARLGHDVTILTPRLGNQPGQEIVDGVPVRRFGPGAPARGVRYYRDYLIPAGLSFLRLLLRHDVLQAFGCNRSVHLGSRIAGFLGKVVVVKLETGGPEGDLESFCGGAGGRARFDALKKVVHRFIAVSAQTRGELERFGVPPDRVAFIPNCVDTGQFRMETPEARALLKARLGMDGKRWVLAGGRLVPRKRIDWAIRIFGKAAGLHADLNLCLMGDGAERPALEALARSLGLSDRVRFVGAVSNVEEYLACADIYLHTASAEGLPLAVLEAQATGTPVVAPGIEGIREVIDPGSTGFLFAPDSEAEGVQVLCRALAGDHDALRRQARRFVEENYSCATVVRRYVRMLAESGLE